MKKIEVNGETFTKKDHEELIKLCEEFLGENVSPAANQLRAAIMRGYDKWDDETE